MMRSKLPALAGTSKPPPSITSTLSQPSFLSRARARLKKLGCDNVEVMLGDGFDVPASAGNFDRIMVTAAMEQIPEGLTQRLKPGGILIAPVGPHHDIQTLVRVTRTDAGFKRKELVDVRFVPPLPGIAREL